MLAFMLCLVASVYIGYRIGSRDFSPGINDSIKKGQEDAIDIVWNQIFGMKGSPPKIIWVEKPDLTCNKNGSFWNPLSGSGDECVNGLFFPFAVMIAWPRGSKFSNTAFCHELLHARQWVLKQEVDVGHTSPEWKDPNGVLYEAIGRLKDSGL